MTSFALTSKDEKLEHGGQKLYAKCKNKKGAYEDSTIDLDTIIGNTDGFFMWGGVNYSQTAKDISLKQGHFLIATMKKEDGTWREPQGIDLGDRIQNLNGDLTFVSPQTKTSFALTSKDENLEHDGQKLYAKCLNKKGAYEDSTLDLDNIIGNTNGFFMWGGVNYSQTAKNTSLKQGHYLEATMKKEDGTWGEPQGIDLGDRIQNIDGDLTYVSPQTITSFDPTSKDETLEHGGQKLYAKCLNKAGAYEDTTIDLDKFIGNIDGFFMWGGADYSKTAKAISLKQGHYLEATMQKEDATWGEPQSLDLGEHIQNIDGNLVFV